MRDAIYLTIICLLGFVVLHYCTRPEEVNNDLELQTLNDSLDYYKELSDSLEAREPEIIVIREKIKDNEKTIDSVRAIHGSFTDVYYKITNDSIR